jgi:hypothetical protein
MCMHVKEIISEYACIGIIMMCVHVQEYQLCACMYRNINYVYACMRILIMCMHVKEY